MYNPLIDAFPGTVEVEGKAYGINADFRNIIKIITILEDDIFTERERQMSALSWFYQNVPKNVKEALEQMYDFINLYRISKSNEQHEPYYDFDEDAGMIFSAFFQVYGLDLTQTDMHWFKFILLFENLNDGTPMFVKVVGYRSEKVSPNASSEYKNHLDKMKQQYQLSKNKKLLKKLMKKRRKVGILNE